MEALFDDANAAYLEQGVFYVKAPTIYPPSLHSIRERLQRADTIDAVFSMGALTSPGGHPVALMVDVLSKSVYGGATYEDFAGQAFHEVEKEDEVVRALDTLVAQDADFVKALLLYSEDYANPGYDRSRAPGLDPALMPIIVREAATRGLRVTAHVQSAVDFRHAVAAGVAEIAHVPGYGWGPMRDSYNHIITADDAAAAEANNVAVVTTTVQPAALRDDHATVQKFYDAQRRNLRTLMNAHVEIRIGSDIYDRAGTGEDRHATRAEVAHLIDLGVFNVEHALSHWISTGRAIFPDRRIACFWPGCDASFLVFDADPREDFSRIATIRCAIKQGATVLGKISQ